MKYSTDDLELFSSDLNEAIGKVQRVLEVADSLLKRQRDNADVMNENNHFIAKSFSDIDKNAIALLPQAIEKFSQLEDKFKVIEKSVSILTNSVVKHTVINDEKEIKVELLDFDDIVEKLRFLSDSNTSAVMQKFISVASVQKYSAIEDLEAILEKEISKIMNVSTSLSKRLDELSFAEYHINNLPQDEKNRTCPISEEVKDDESVAKNSIRDDKALLLGVEQLIDAKMSEFTKPKKSLSTFFVNVAILIFLAGLSVKIFF